MKHTSKLSKKLTTAVISLALLFGIVIMGSPIFTKLPVFAVSDKVTICHATSSETNQYNTIVVSINAIGGHFDNPGTPKAGHEDDLLFLYETECPGTEVSVTPTVTPTQTPSPTPTKTPGCGCTPDEDDDPTITPRPTSAPTHTPTPTQGQVNEPTATPGAGAPTATPTPTPTPGPIGGGSTDNGSSSTGTVAGTTASTTQGQVLGASTTSLPNTGGFYEMISLLMTSGGSMLMAGSLFSYAKTKKENK